MLAIDWNRKLYAKEYCYNLIYSSLEKKLRSNSSKRFNSAIGREFNCICENKCTVDKDITVCSKCKHWWNLEEISGWLKFGDKTERVLLYGDKKLINK